MKRIGSWALVLAMAATLMGCAASSTEATDPSGTADPTAAVSTTDPGNATQPGNTTTPAQGTEPGKETEPASEGTQPSGGSGNQGGNSGSQGSGSNGSQGNSGAPAVTQPKPTEPPHTHSYTTSTVAPTCTDKGYTLHKCSCGDSYKDGETAALGHSWGDWTVTVEATYDAEGEQARTCATCGATETQAIDKLEAEVIDCAALASYGRSYAASMGWDLGSGLAGYYPALDVQINTMSEGYSQVAGCVDATCSSLLAVSGGDVKCARIDVAVIHESGNIYRVYVYYG